MVIQVSRRSRDCGAEETITMNSFRFDPSVSGRLAEDDLDLLGVGAKYANGKTIPKAMRPEHAKWIGMRRGEETVQLVRRQSCDFKRFHFWL